MHLAHLSLAALAAPLVLAQNHPPSAPVFTEPSANRIVNPADVHMETAPFADPDPGDQHVASDWEIWRVSPNERVWHAYGMTGPERTHVHLGDGVFENSHAGWTRLFASTSFTVRARHEDSSGDPLTQWSPWTSQPFSTGPAGVKAPLMMDDVEASPAPRWTYSTSGLPVELPTGSPQPTLRLESGAGWLLLRIDADPAPGNRITNPPPLPAHFAVRVVIDAGNTGSNLVLPDTDLLVLEHGCEAVKIRLPGLSLPPAQTAIFWVSEEGATYNGAASPTVPDFTSPARGILPPWVMRTPGFAIDVVASGLTMPVNIAFIPGAGTQPGDPKFYVTELYGTIKMVTNAGTVSNYATGLLNYAPSGIFPGSGEQGLTGIAVDPVSHDVFAAHLWQTGGNTYPRITRLTSIDGGRTSSSRSVILDMQGETQGQSHQISRLEIVSGELYCHMGDGMVTSTGQNGNSYRGKILRMNLDGSPVPSNPLYNGGARDSLDYIYCIGLRNPFGGAWRALDGFRYEVENGPEVDRFAKLVIGRNFAWDGSNASMHNFASYVWDPSCGPVNLAFVQPQTFGGSGFPSNRMDHAFVTESGATYAEGQQSIGKRITEFTLDAAGNVVTGPVPFAEYVGDGFATAVGLAAGPDGLYFTELYRDLATTGPTATGGRILRIRAGDPLDCNGNGLADWCEIANGAVPDCNGNQVPDACDILNGTSHDFDHNGRPDECDPLSESTDHLSLGTGGRVDFTLNAGPVNAGMLYFLLGSMTGTAPGTPFGSVVLPLNSVNDPWFQLTSALFNPAMLQNTLSFLDGQGRAAAALVAPPLPPSLLGLQLHHAYLVIDLGALQARSASNAVPLVLAL